MPWCGGGAFAIVCTLEVRGQLHEDRFPLPLLRVVLGLNWGHWDNTVNSLLAEPSCCSQHGFYKM